MNSMMPTPQAHRFLLGAPGINSEAANTICGLQQGLGARASVDPSNINAMLASLIFGQKMSHSIQAMAHNLRGINHLIDFHLAVQNFHQSGQNFHF